VIPVRGLIYSIASELNDIEPGYEHTRWPLPLLFQFIDEANNHILSLRPAVFTTSYTMPLVPGVVQTLPDEVTAMVGIVGVDYGAGLTRAASFGSDELTRWLTSTCAASTDAINVAVDPTSIRTFYVSPPAPSYPVASITFNAIVPAPLVLSVNDTIRFSGGDARMYYNQIKDYVLYRAFAVDTESSTSIARSNQHFDAYNRAMTPPRARNAR
jgi:hypothetical protein